MIASLLFFFSLLRHREPCPRGARKHPGFANNAMGPGAQSSTSQMKACDQAKLPIPSTPATPSLPQALCTSHAIFTIFNNLHILKKLDICTLKPPFTPFFTRPNGKPPQLYGTNHALPHSATASSTRALPLPVSNRPRHSLSLPQRRTPQPKPQPQPPRQLYQTACTALPNSLNSSTASEPNTFSKFTEPSAPPPGPS